MKLIQSLFLVSSSALLMIACNKDVVTYLDVNPVHGTTNVKIVHASAYATNYSVQLKVNDVRVSSIITYSTPFPGGGLNTGGGNYPWYFSLTGGSYKISMAVPKTGTNVDSINLYTSTTVNLNEDTYYTAYIADTGVNTQLRLFEENTMLPIDGTSRFKFINLTPNLASADLYWGTSKVASNILYGTKSTDFILNRNDTTRWYLRTAGSLPTSSPIAVYPALSPLAAAQVIPNQRILTVYSRGYVGATGNRVPAISLLYN